MTSLAMVGDSHSAIYMKALRRLKDGPAIVGGPLGAARTYFRPFFDFDGDFAFRDPGIQENYAVWKQVTKSNGLLDFKGSLICSIGLSGASFWSNKFWGEASALPVRGRRFISSGAVDFFVASLQENALKFYQVLIGQGLLLAAVAGPAPQRRSRGARQHSPEELLRLDRLFQKPVRDLLAAANIPVIELDMADKDGFLKPEFEGEDPHHCGMACGPLLAAAIDRLVASRTRQKGGRNKPD
jgi:hypothetical protein